jgi:predicted alpha/beta-fold hydrolase
VYPLTDTWIYFYHVDTPLNKSRIEACPTLRERKFTPTPWLANGYLQAYFGSFKGSLPGNSPYGKSLDYDRELIKLPDGGTVSICWAIFDKELPVNTKILLLAPGVTLSSLSNYTRNPEEEAEAEAHGYGVGVMHDTGIAVTPLTVIFI